MRHRTSAAIRRRRVRWWIALYVASGLALAAVTIRGMLREEASEALRVAFALVGLVALYRWTSGHLSGGRTPSGSAWRLVVRRLAQSVFVFVALLEVVHALIRVAPPSVFRVAIWSLGIPLLLALRALMTALLERAVSRWFILSAGATAAAMTAMLILLLELSLSALSVTFVWFLGALAVAVASLVIGLTRASALEARG